MRTMFRILSLLIPLVVSAGLALLMPESVTPAVPEKTVAWAEVDDVARRLPRSTVAVVEFRDLAHRWNEIRGVPGLARIQDHVLASIGLAPEILPRLAGDRAWLALVADGHSLIPVGVTCSRGAEDAAAMLEETVRGGGDTVASLAVHRVKRCLWITPAEVDLDQVRTPLIEEAGEERRRTMNEAWRRLDEGGLVRGFVDARALGDWIVERALGAQSPSHDLLRTLFTTDLDAVRFIGFRRDLTDRGLETEAVVGYRTEQLPQEIVELLSVPPTTFSRLPAALPDGVAAMASFPTEPQAILAWLRHAAAGDPRGPLRNLEFWFDEFHARTGVEPEQDLFDLLGDRGWLAVLSGESRQAVGLAILLEARDAARLESGLLELRAWLHEHAAGRSLGLIVPHAREATLDGRPIHGTIVRTPLGEWKGPSFVTGDGYVLVASDDRALAEGVRLFETRSSWPPAASQESLMVEPEALMPVVKALVESAHGDGDTPVTGAVMELVSALEDVTLDVFYEGDAVHLHGRAGLVPAPSRNAR